MNAAAVVIARYYTAFNAKDWPAMLACVDEDVRHDVNEGEARRGKALFASFLAHMADSYDERLEDVVVMTDVGGSRAAAEFVVHGVYLKTDGALPQARGQRYVLPGGAFFEVSNGAITRVTTYYNLKFWLQQVSAA